VGKNVSSSAAEQLQSVVPSQNPATPRDVRGLERHVFCVFLMEVFVVADV